MSNQFVGEIRIFGLNFAPLEFAFCNGQIMSIMQNSTLFNLIGTTYGGDGTSTFGLPDLQSRVPIHMGQGPGLSPYIIGAFAGAETVALGLSEMPAHSHNFVATQALASTDTPGTGVMPANVAAVAGETFYMSPGAGVATNMAAGSLGSAGGGQGHANIMPILTLNMCISLFGIFPSRN